MSCVFLAVAGPPIPAPGVPKSIGRLGAGELDCRSSPESGLRVTEPTGRQIPAEQETGLRVDMASSVLVATLCH